jgi:hypothetical protein
LGVSAQSSAEPESVGAGDDGLLLRVRERPSERLVQQAPLELDALPRRLIDLCDEVVIESV